MYGSYGMYSGNKCNFSASTMYKQAGVVNMSTSSNKISGVMTSLPSTQTTSVIISITTPEKSFQTLTNVLPFAQHIDYQQNPNPSSILNDQHTLFAKQLAGAPVVVIATRLPTFI